MDSKNAICGIIGQNFHLTFAIICDKKGIKSDDNHYNDYILGCSAKPQ